MQTDDKREVCAAGLRGSYQLPQLLDFIAARYDSAAERMADG